VPQTSKMMQVGGVEAAVPSREASEQHVSVRIGGCSGADGNKNYLHLLLLGLHLLLHLLHLLLLLLLLLLHGLGLGLSPHHCWRGVGRNMRCRTY